MIGSKDNEAFMTHLCCMFNVKKRHYIIVNKKLLLIWNELVNH